MIKNILIVNRGEITKRIKNTCNRLNLNSIAIFTPKERNASWLRGLESYSLDKDSYLSIPKIIEIIKLSNANAVHPGYGFLSENAGFAEVLEKEGVIFIGPNPRAMFMMVSRSTALMAEVSLALSIETKHEFSKEFLFRETR